MNAPVRPRARLNIDEFLAWNPGHGERYELVDGAAVAMGRDSIRHNRAKTSAWRALDDAIRARGLPCMSFVDGIGVKVNEHTLRLPDVVVHCGAPPDPNALVLEQPLLVVEVVSPSSERQDRETKFLDYFSIASIRHYLILYAQERAVVHHDRSAADEISTRILRDGELRLDPPGFSVSVESLLGPHLSGEGTA